MGATRSARDPRTQSLVQWYPIGDRPRLFGCPDLAVFKAFFNRTKDWADLEEMVEAGSLDGGRVLGEFTLHLGGDDERVEGPRSLLRPAS